MAPEDDAEYARVKQLLEKCERWESTLLSANIVDIVLHGPAYFNAALAKE